jgi:hypothetical protein
VLVVWTTRGVIRLRICPLCTAVTVAPDRHAAAHRAERERPQHSQTDPAAGPGQRDQANSRSG